VTDRARASRGFLLALFVAALVLRIGAMLALGEHRHAAGASAWDWGHEAASLAKSLVDGHVYGDPWGKGTGPSSWLTPPYPALLALLIAAFGGIGPAAALVLFTLQSIVSAATCPLLVLLGREAGAERAGRLAGLVFAVYPIAISNAVQLVWDTTFVAAGVVLVLLLVLRVRADRASPLRAGLAYGALLFLNPAPLGAAPALAAFVFRRGRIRALALFLASAFAVCVPWAIRNQVVLGAFSLRPNFGVELRIGNHDDANGRPIPFKYHPSHIEAERELYVRLGEVEYARENLGRAREWITEHPGRFAALSARRFALFWVGESPLSDPRRESGRSPAGDFASWLKYVVYAATGACGLAGAAFGAWPSASRRLIGFSLLLFGLPYYLSHVSERYRFPVDPLLVLSSAALVMPLLERSTARLGRSPTPKDASA
jgi:4-amino-4-deoxy-L-arabinose transferase-like glycosyltransferase